MPVRGTQFGRRLEARLEAELYERPDAPGRVVRPGVLCLAPDVIELDRH